MFGFSRLKLIGYGLALLAVLGVVWQVNHWRVQAGQKKAAVAALAVEVKAHKDDLAAAKVELAVSEKARVKLANDGAAVKAAFAEQLASIKPKTLIVTKVVPGETCPRSTLSPDFLLHFNAAGEVPVPLQ
jgi:hypothetical protein